MDSGSIEIISEKRILPDKWERHYQGHYEDFGKLPILPDMANGSDCLFFEGQYARYSEKEQRWIEFGKEGA